MDDDLTQGNDAPEPDEKQLTLDSVLDEQFGFDERGEATVEADEPTPGEGADAPDEPAADQPPAEPEQPKPAEPEKADPNAELYAPLPEHNPRKTHERFQKLVEGHKEVVSKLTAVEQEREQIKSQVAKYEAGLQPLREMGFDNQEAVADLQQFAQYRKALASGNVQGAMDLLQKQMNTLALAAGRRVEVNPLKSFPELEHRVLTGELDEQTALELARSRHTSTVQQEQQQRHQQAEQQHSQRMGEIHAGASAVTQVVQQLQMDADFAAVLPHLQSQLEHIKSAYHPGQWAAEVRRTYEYEKRLLAAQNRPVAPPRQQPLRGNGHVGGQPTPTNAADAAVQALGLG